MQNQYVNIAPHFEQGEQGELGEQGEHGEMNQFAKMKLRVRFCHPITGNLTVCVCVFSQK